MTGFTLPGTPVELLNISNQDVLLMFKAVPQVLIFPWSIYSKTTDDKRLARSLR